MSRSAPAPPDTPERFLLIAWGVLPFLLAPGLQDPATLPRTIAASALFIAAMAWFAARGTPLSLPRILAVLLAAGPALAVLGLAWAPLPGDGLFDALKTLLPPAAALVMATVFGSAPRTPLLWTRIAAAQALLLATIALLQAGGIAFTTLPGHFTIYATLSNKNLLAQYLMLLLPLVLYGLLDGSRHWSLLHGAAWLAGILVIALTHTRSVAVALLLVTAGLALWLWRRGELLALPLPLRAILRRRLILAALLAAVAIVVGVAALQGIRSADPDTHRRITGSYPTLSSSTERLDLWRKSLAMIAAHPLGGVGTGGWKLMVHRYGVPPQRARSGELQFIRPHNDYLWIAAENGPLALAVFVALLAMAIAAARRIVYNHPNPNARILALTGAAGIALYAIVAIFSFPRERILPAIMLGGYIALLIPLLMELPAKPAWRPVRIRTGIWLAGIVAMSALPGVAAIRWTGETAVADALDAQRRMQWARIPGIIADGDHGLFPLDAAAVPLPFYSGMAHIELGRLDRARSDLTAAIARHPGHLLSLRNLGAVHARLGDLDGAAALFERVLTFSPGLEPTLLNLTAVRVQQGRYREALEVLSRCDPASTNPRIPAYRKAIEAKLGSMEQNSSRDE